MLSSELERLEKYLPIERELKKAEKKHPNFPEHVVKAAA